ncbi:MAG: PaaI family thioesterase [Pseudomonadota bacterium]
MSVFFAKTPDEMATLDDLRSRSGLEFVQDMLAGKLACAPIARTLNFTLTEVSEGQVAFEGAPTFDALNPMSGVHGGWYGALLDSVLGCAVMTIVPRGRVYTTLEYKVNIARAITPGQKVRATSQVDHGGRSTAVAHGEIRGIEDGKLYAKGSTTCLIMDAPPA